MYDIIVVGGGMAGMTASLYALRNNKKVLIIEKEAIGGQIAGSPKVENYPSRKSVSGAELADELFEQISSLGVDFEIDNVQKVEKKENCFVVECEYSSFKGKSVIIATGSKHRRLGLDREDEFLGKGIYYCAICDGPFFAGKDVCVIGDANSAMQYALMLSEYCSHVKMITLFDKLFGEKSLQNAVRNTKNIEIVHNSKAIKILGENTFEGLLFEKEDHSVFEEKPSAVFVAIGQVPDNSFLDGVTLLDKQGYIVAGENCETQIPGLFVAGDCRTKEVRQVTTAVGDGAVAAMRACKYLSSISD